MKLLTYLAASQPTLGVVINDTQVLNVSAAWDGAGGGAAVGAPRTVLDLIELGDAGLEQLRQIVARDAQTPGERLPLSGLQWLAPIPLPRKNVFCVGRNYREHIIEGNLARGRDPHDFPKALEFFSKAPTTVVGHRAPVKLHGGITKMLDYEIELGIVIGKGGVNISRENALEHVFGYTIVNDVTARDLQALHGQWFKGKTLDTSCPIGPYIVHRSAVPDAQALQLELDVNGELRQQSSTSSMLFGVPEIIEQLSAGLTLSPGDIIATGTPSGVGFAKTPPLALKAGDVMRARIAGFGELENTIVEF
ncbi:MAG: fumarylacetoacetate hydrolase family protein [Janthinobacterium lividum]